MPLKCARALLCAALLVMPRLAAAAPLAWITNQGTHDVSIVVAAAAKVVARVKAGKSPAGIAVSVAAGKVFVTN